ncbi:MAG: AI-2E family transporter [Dysosmobacter sp.]
MTSRSARAVSLVVTWVIIGLLCYLLGHVLIPQLYRSVVQLISSVEGYYNTISGWVEHLLESNPTVEVWVAGQMDKFYESATEWLKNQVFTRTQMLMIAVSGGVLSTLVFLKNLLVGMIVSVYFMATKERCAAHARKLAYSLFSEEAVYWVFRGSAKVDRIFSGFVRGKLLDSLIIGVLCFIGCSLLDMPYTPLVSVFVGVTNVIPFFGPFLGAIPSFFLILLVDPIQSLYFLLFVLALQQLDGNVIGPKILGESTGLSSLWVIIAILVGGSFFGVAGMFFGVPVCACLYSLVAFLVDRRLAEKDLPVETEHYTAPLPEQETEPENRRKRRKTCKKGLQSAAVSCTIQPCGHIVRKITNDVSQGCFCGLATAYSSWIFSTRKGLGICGTEKTAPRIH